MKYCHNCGKQIDEKAVICVHCGVQQPRVGGSSGLDLDLDEKNRVVAALLAILLGWFGAHKFYLGQPNSGVVYLIFCWTLIPGIIGLVEGVTYLGMSDEDFAAKYG